MALLATVRKAVLSHSCDTCGLDIPPGKRYIRLFYTRDEKPGSALRTFKECESCAIYSKRSGLLKNAIGTKIRKTRKKAAAAAAVPKLATRPQTVNASALAGLGAAAKVIADGMPAVIASARALSVAQAARQRALRQSV